MGAVPTPLMQNRTLNPDIGITPVYIPFQFNARSTRSNYHFPGVSLGMSMVEDR